MQVNPAAHDAIIIIFGAGVRPDGSPSGTLRARVEAAAAFGRGFARPLFIPTGAKGRYGEAEAVVMERLLVGAGYPRAWIWREETGTDTLSSARATARMVGLATVRMVAAGVPVYACSSGYHLPRCVALLRIAGVKARSCPPPRVPAATGLRQRWYWRLREVPALPYDAALMVWLRVSGKV